MVGNRQPGDLYDLGDAGVAPTQIYRPHGAWDAHVGARSVPLRGVIVIICANLRHLRFDGRGVGVVGVNIHGR